MLRDNLLAVFGTKVVSALEPVTIEGAGFTVTGLVSSAVKTGSKTNGDRQFFFLNGRPVELPKALRVVNDVYKCAQSSVFGIVMLALVSSLQGGLIPWNSQYQVQMPMCQRTLDDSRQTFCRSLQVLCSHMACSACRSLSSPATAGCKAMFALAVTVSRAEVDVNVTPDKRTVMLHREGAFMAALREGAGGRLGSQQVAVFAVAG